VKNREKSSDKQEAVTAQTVTQLITEQNPWPLALIDNPVKFSLVNHLRNPREYSGVTCTGLALD